MTAPGQFERGLFADAIGGAGDQDTTFVVLGIRGGHEGAVELAQASSALRQRATLAPPSGS
jgi:hypothetical protein